MDALTMLDGRPLTEQQTRARILRALCRWKDIFSCAATLKQRQSIADEIMASRALAACGGEIAGQAVARLALNAVVARQAGNPLDL